MLPRFGRGPRLIHWLHAVPFLALLATGLVLFVPSIKALHVGGYRLLPLLHVLVGIAFIASPIPAYFALPDRSRVHDDMRRLYRFNRSDRAWLSYAFGALLGARVHIPPTGKYNTGQKLNAIFSVIVTLGLMASGAVLAVNYFTKSVFSARFVEQIFPLHDLFMLVSLPVVAVHIYLGSLNPSTKESLRGIVHGFVRRDWAKRHHSLWVEEIDRHK
ncbi:MAG: formate dehydrogenase subunit gamma [Dehalococcoidia bacterium]